jgi:hypothetical protein
MLVSGKARASFVISLSASAPNLFTAQTLRFNLGPATLTAPLTAETLGFSPYVAGSTPLTATSAQRLESGIKLAREASIWLAQQELAFFSNPANDVAAIGTLSCLAGPNPICAGSVSFLLASAKQQFVVASLDTLIDLTPASAADKQAAHNLVAAGDLLYSAFSLKPDGTFESALDLLGTSWDVLQASLELNRLPSGEVVGLQCVGVGSNGKQMHGFIARKQPVATVENYNVALIPPLDSAGLLSGGGTYPTGRVVNVLAEPNPGYTFVNWTEAGNPVTNSPSFTFVASANRTLVANFTAVPPDPCPDNNEPNNSLLTATPLAPATPAQGRICTASDVDWFKVNVAQPGTLTFNLSVPADNDYDLELYGPDTYYLKGSYGDVGAAETITHNALATGDYFVRVYGYPPGNGSFNTSSDYTLTASFTTGQISIITPPQDRSVIEGASAVFNVTAGGAAPLAYQWQKNGVNIPGAMASSYVTPPATLADSGAQFRVILTNAFGAVTSSWATLTVNPANTITWTGTVSSDWNNPTNWSPQTVPTASDRVVINSGSVNVSPGAAFGILNLNGAQLTGDFAVNGTLNWFSGTLSATIANAPGGVVNIMGSGTKNFFYGPFNNAGTITWSSSGVIQTGYGFVLSNQAGALFEVQGDATMNYVSQSQPTFNNSGTLRKSRGAGTTYFSSVVFNNTGTVEAQTGTLWFGAGGQLGGTFRTGSGASTMFSGDADHGWTSVRNTQVVFEGEGTNRFHGTWFTLDGGAVLHNLEFTGGWLTGEGTITGISGLRGGNFGGAFVLFGTLNWTEGSLDGAVMTVAPGGVLNLNGPGVQRFRGARINNAGTMVWRDNGLVWAYRDAGQSVISNQASGVFEIQGDGAISPVTGGAGGLNFYNAGAFRKVSGTNESFLGVPFYNTGTVEVQSGTLTFNEGFNQASGSARLAGGSFRGSTFIFTGGTLWGSGVINGLVVNAGEISPGGSPGTITIVGSYTQTAAGRLTVEIGGLSPSIQHDQLVVNGPATLDGALQVSFTNGFAPQPGDFFNVLSCASRSGAFAASNAGLLGLAESYTATGLRLIASSNVYPSLSFAVSGGNTQAVCVPFQLQAAAADVDGALTNLSIYLNGSPLTSAPNSPVATQAEIDFPALYTFTARAQDNQGGTTWATQEVALVTQPLHVLTAGFRSNGVFKLCLSGEPGRAYQLQANTNLSTTNWAVIGVMESTNGVWRLLDKGATNQPWQFYRAVQLP